MPLFVSFCCVVSRSLYRLVCFPFYKEKKEASLCWSRIRFFWKRVKCRNEKATRTMALHSGFLGRAVDAGSRPFCGFSFLSFWPLLLPHWFVEVEQPYFNRSKSRAAFAVFAVQPCLAIAFLGTSTPLVCKRSFPLSPLGTGFP